MRSHVFNSCLPLFSYNYFYNRTAEFGLSTRQSQSGSSIIQAQRNNLSQARALKFEVQAWAKVGCARFGLGPAQCMNTPTKTCVHGVRALVGPLLFPHPHSDCLPF
eukprot:TRINITY_DN4815_c0_g3_i1.p1 TRINITY_DN4815_c0_g3~~TRINITY_DN4815_c0_g3_i1.p1  ORF type:complete len:106 (+),score=2.96 TRINITY_DN4815_c0_g3_i1:236-553(+)